MPIDLSDYFIISEKIKFTAKYELNGLIIHYLECKTSNF